MTKINLWLGIIALTIFLGCTQSKDTTGDTAFVLNGELEGIANGHWIYLFLNNQSLDSTQVVESKFSFRGNVDHPTQYTLLVKDSRNNKRIWIEPGNIAFKAKDGTFTQAEISGSSTQEEQDILESLIKGYRYRRDSLTNILRDSDASDNLKENAREDLKAIYDTHLEIEKDFIKNYPNSMVSVMLLDIYGTTIGREKTKDLYDILNDRLKWTSYGKNVNRFLTLNKNLKIGDQYIDFSMTDDKGQLTQLSDIKAKLLLLDFWASWCGPCIEEYPALKKAYSKFKNQGFEIVGVSQDQSKARWLKAIQENELEWINLRDEKGMQADPYFIYNISGIPDNILINEEGAIVARNLRGEELIKLVEQNL